jgi:hypothetical protein
MLMQADGGGFYGAFDDNLYGLGSDVDDMMENLLNQDRGPLI